jgi:hypothetical protein
LAQVILVDTSEEVLIVLSEDISIMEVVFQNLLIKTIKLFNSVLGHDEAVFIENGLLRVVNHLSLHVLGEGVVRFGLGKYIHLLGDDLNVIDVLNRENIHDNKVGHNT